MMILSGTEETLVDPQKLINKGYVKSFQEGELELDNGLIFHYDIPSTSRVSKLRLRVLHVKFILVVISS